MNSVPIAELGQVNSPQSLGLNRFGQGAQRAHAAAPPQWLPIPAARKTRPAPKANPTKARSLWHHVRPSCPAPIRIEGLLLALVSGAAALGVAYGFWCLVDLVQHWALFNAGVEHLIQ